MEPDFAIIANAGLRFNRLSDVLVLADTPRLTALRINRMQRGAVTSNSSRPNFPVEIVQSPQVIRGLNSPPERVIN